MQSHTRANRRRNGRIRRRRNRNSRRVLSDRSYHKIRIKEQRDRRLARTDRIDYLLRRNCVISLANPLGDCRQRARVTYTGGYVLPGTAVGAGQTALPDDLEQAMVEQVACWFMNRDKL